MPEFETLIPVFSDEHASLARQYYWAVIEKYDLPEAVAETFSNVGFITILNRMFKERYLSKDVTKGGVT